MAQIIRIPKYTFRTIKSGDSCGDLPMILEKKFNDAFTPINLTGASIKAQFKRDVNGPVIFELSTTNGLFEITDATAGEFTRKNFRVAVPAGRYISDLQVTFADGTVKTYADLDWSITPEATQ